MATTLSNLLTVLVPKRKSKAGGQANTATYNPQQPAQVLTLPQYQDHLIDIFETRVSDDSRDLIKYMFQHDPDVSAAVFSYQTLADTPLTIYVRNFEGEIDRDATRQLHQAIEFLTRPVDYSLGFQLKPNLSAICDEMRYMALMRGTLAAELVLDKQGAPSQIRLIDSSSLRWYEQKTGDYKPRQNISGQTDGIDLNLPTVFVSFFRRDPTTIYTKSTFVSAINTIAARQQVVNDLYRIMQRTGYPRMTVKVIEEVLRKNLPDSVRGNTVEETNWIRSQISSVTSNLQSQRPDDVFVHTDSIEPGIINDKAPGVGIDISSVIETLNAQNQAGLKTMATVIGRGTSGVNTGSVEARIAALNADKLNQPVAEILTDIFSLILHLNGIQGFAIVEFSPAELRPALELEAQKSIRAARLRNDLSDGLITDDEYHLWLYGRLRPDLSPELMGTKFQSATEMINSDNISPNGDPLGRSISSEGADMAKSDGVNP